jgi:protein-S-isoprenylcysteine O-methyltransferase Ste14
MEVHAIRIIASVIYLSGLGFAEALRLPRRVDRIRERRVWSRGRVPFRISEFLVVTSVILGIWVFPIAYTFTDWLRPFDYGLPVWAVYLAVFVFCVGLLIRWRAQISLASQWSFTLETVDDHTLVTSGIYSFMRHPIYVSLILWALTQPVLLQNLIAGLGGVISVALIWIVRVPREERMMIELFGEEYRQYMSRTGIFFPKRQAKDQVT